MAHYNSSAGRYGSGRFASGGQAASEEDFDDDDDDSIGHDRIRRNYLHQHHQAANSANLQQQQQQDATEAAAAAASTGPFRAAETIQVKLNEGYFASERKAVVNLLANCRQKCSSMQMFNPAKNQSIKEQQQQWDENVSALARSLSLQGCRLSSVYSRCCCCYYYWIHHSSRVAIGKPTRKGHDFGSWPGAAPDDMQ